MLSVLHIENIAVIEQADIVFNQGFNVLTGETGAGKSIVIDAISAILGERAYRDMVRTGAAKASVRALFRQVPELPWFQENGVPYEEETLIQREIYLDGKNVCRVNGQLLSVSILRKLGLQLINIHGQRDSQQLFDEGYHLAFLDAFALRKARQDGAERLAARILEELRQLDMPRVQFQCQFTQTELSPVGADAVAFYMSANVGEALKPMNKVASGGELARSMLALKNVARNKQVLCVTHLPQIAALADTHLLIAKGEREGRTYTTVTPLDREGRKLELARIIGGASITETTLRSAEEMLTTEVQ